MHELNLPAASPSHPVARNLAVQFTDGSLYEGGWREDVPEAEKIHGIHRIHPPINQAIVKK